MKGQISYVIKPFALVLMVIVLLALYGFLNMSEADLKRIERNNELMNTATATLLLLANSEDCLAYQVKETSSSYANIIDVQKLNEFAQKYKDIEPECARSYEFGFRVKINDIENSSGWEFGASNFSTGKAYRNSVEYWMPVAIRYSKKVVKPGKITIYIVDGELEKIAGFLDLSCKLGMLGQKNATTTKISLSYPLTYFNNTLCIESNPKKCRKVLCKLDFKDIKSKGVYRITTSFKYPNKLMVRT